MTTENKKKIDEYWTERALQQEHNAQIVADRYMAQIGQSLADYKHQLVSEIEKFYARYAVDNKMTHAEAKQYLTDKERREFKHVTLERFREMALNPDTPTPLLDALGYRHRISRKEALLAEIERLTAELYGKPDGIHDKVTEALSDVYIKGKIHQAKNLAHFGIIEKPILGVDAVKHKMASNWSGKTFSENVWVHKEVAYKAISDVLNKGLTGGWSIDRMARALSERTGVAYHRADTLVRTETTFYNNLATLDTIKELGGDHYEIVAVLDSRTSEICQSENHKVYSVKEYEPGRTAPPFHVRCRSTIRPAVKSDKKGKADKTDRTEEAEQISPYLDILLNNAPVKMAKEKRSLDEIFAGWEREGEAVLRGVKKSKTASTPSASYQEFKKDMTFVYAVSRDKDDISKQELTKMLKPHYSLGNLFNHDLFGDYSNREVIIPNHMIAYALTKHRDQIHLQEFFKIKEVIERPDFVSEDILGTNNAFLLNKKVDENRFIEAGIEDKNGQFIFHFMVRNKNKNNKRLKKIMKKSKKYDIIDQKVYNIDKE
nr:MAG TPA: minor capsid protein [Caudoviricetes sp.]